MILPYFDYGDILFSKSSKKLLDKLDRLQRRALRVCLRADSDMPENVLLKNATIAPLEKRRYTDLMNFMYKKNCTEL